MPVAVPVSVAAVLLAVTTVAVVVGRRRRGPRIADQTAAERALRAHNERVAAQGRATRMHPDAVRHWMAVQMLHQAGVEAIIGDDRIFPTLVAAAWASGSRRA